MSETNVLDLHFATLRCQHVFEDDALSVEAGIAHLSDPHRYQIRSGSEALVLRMRQAPRQIRLETDGTYELSHDDVLHRQPSR